MALHYTSQINVSILTMLQIGSELVFLFIV